MARFRITFGKHRQRPPGSKEGRTYTRGEEIDLDHYDPKWQDKFEGREARADQLKRTAITLNRKVWEKDLKVAAAEADAIERKRYFMDQRREGRVPSEPEIAQHVSRDLREQAPEPEMPLEPEGATLELTGGPVPAPPPEPRRGPGRPPNPRPAPPPPN